MICLIPARKGSKRLPGKNMRLLGGLPLIHHTLAAAYDSECFSKVVVSSDWAELLEYAAGTFGAETIVRPPHLATDESLDVDWIRHALGTLEYRWESWPSGPKDFCLLRPTSPFRGPETIQRACALWRDIGEHYDSLRAVRRASECPWKMWRYAEDTHELDPITSVAAQKHLHSRPTQVLEEAWVQTAGLEIAWTRTILELGSLAGNRVAGFVCEGAEGLDLNSEAEWAEAEREIESRLVQEGTTQNPG